MEHKKIRKKILIATIKGWNIDHANRIKEEIKGEWEVFVFSDRGQLTVEKIKEISPEFIFFPHWSWKIEPEIYEHFPCIGFHMTDLPFGRGGSPLQNLIVRGFQETKIAAFLITEVMDGGPIYLKRDLSLSGSGETIFKRASDIIFQEMIPFILENPITPVAQEGQIVAFDRRRPEDGEIKPSFELNQIYDYIRMLDAEGYPNAFIRFGPYRISFSEADLSEEGIVARVYIKENKDGK